MSEDEIIQDLRDYLMYEHCQRCQIEPRKNDKNKCRGCPVADVLEGRLEK